jgi:bacterioferritin
MTQDDFVLDVTRIREEARQKMEAGPVTDAYGLHTDRVVALLNDVIATEVVCWLRYTRHAISATGIDRAQVAAEFTEHAKEEMQHALRAAERVSQLGAEPDFDPATMAQRAHTDYAAIAGSDLKEMLRNNLLAERIVIASYQEIIRWLGDHDPTTRRLMESILEEEEEHADDLTDLLGV